MWCVPEASAEYVACMENILGLYEAPYDPKRPLVCFDEGRGQLIEETRLRLPPRPVRREHFDYEYRCKGVRNLTLFFKPLVACRPIGINERHTMQDFAQNMKWLVDEVQPEAEIVRAVLDNLSTHKTAALYETFPPVEARRIVKNPEFQPPQSMVAG
jgi:hypothetical protein